MFVSTKRFGKEKLEFLNNFIYTEIFHLLFNIKLSWSSPIVIAFQLRKSNNDSFSWYIHSISFSPITYKLAKQFIPRYDNEKCYSYIQNFNRADGASKQVI